MFLLTNRASCKSLALPMFTKVGVEGKLPWR